MDPPHPTIPRLAMVPEVRIPLAVAGAAANPFNYFARKLIFLLIVGCMLASMMGLDPPNFNVLQAHVNKGLRGAFLSPWSLILSFLVLMVALLALSYL